MRCPQCGSQIVDGARFCPRCGSELVSVSEQRGDGPGGTARPPVSKRAAFIAGIAVVFVVVAVAVCAFAGVFAPLQVVETPDGVPASDEGGVSDGRDVQDGDDVTRDPVRSAVEDAFGIADTELTGTWFTSTAHEGNTARVEVNTSAFDEDAGQGAVWWGTYDDDGVERICCIYLLDDDDTYEDQGIGLYAATGTVDGGFSDSYLLAGPHTASRVYLALRGSSLVVATFTDKTEGSYDGHYFLSRDQSTDSSWSSNTEEYEEEVRVFDLAQGFVSGLTVSRVIESPAANETMVCTIERPDEQDVVYAAGFTSYSNASATVLSSEQEFLDRANTLLERAGVDWLALGPTSWSGRWDGFWADEEELGDTLARVDITCSYGVEGEDFTVSGDVLIQVNDANGATQGRGAASA